MASSFLYPTFKERYLTKKKKLDLSVGDTVTIPFTREDNVCEAVLFYIINIEETAYSVYVDLMSVNVNLIKPFRWLSNLDVSECKTIPIKIPYCKSNIYRVLNSLVTRFPEEVQEAMVAKEEVRYSFKNGQESYTEPELIGKIWALDSDEVFSYYTTHIDPDKHPYVLRRFPFFVDNPEYFQAPHQPIALRNKLLPDRISYIEDGFLHITNDLTLEYHTPICMRLKIYV